jgi:hypothetical protein
MDLQNSEGDLLPSKPPEPASPPYRELEENIRVLKRIIVATLVALMFLGFGINSYMWRQSTMASRQLVEAKKLVDEYQHVKEPMIKNFISQLQAYAQAHPDFQPILSKYIEPPAVKSVVAPTNSLAPRPVK